MAYSEPNELLDLNSSSLSRHLSILQDGGLVNNILGWNENSYSYYTTTESIFLDLALEGYFITDAINSVYSILRLIKILYIDLGTDKRWMT